MSLWWVLKSYHLWSLVVLVVAVCLFLQRSQPCCAASESHTAPAASGTACSSPLASQTPHCTFFCNPPSSGTNISDKSLFIQLLTGYWAIILKHDMMNLREGTQNYFTFFKDVISPLMAVSSSSLHWFCWVNIFSICLSWASARDRLYSWYIRSWWVCLSKEVATNIQKQQKVL